MRFLFPIKCSVFQRSLTNCDCTMTNVYSNKFRVIYLVNRCAFYMRVEKEMCYFRNNIYDKYSSVLSFESKLVLYHIIRCIIFHLHSLCQLISLKKTCRWEEIMNLLEKIFIIALRHFTLI